MKAAKSELKKSTSKYNLLRSITLSSKLGEAFFFKDRLLLGQDEKFVAMMSTWTEGLIGVSLIDLRIENSVFPKFSKTQKLINSKIS